jgi:anti-sigma factor RsiW
MDCAEFKRLLTEYAEGTLAPALSKEAREHLASCSNCAQEQAAYKAAVKAVGLLQERESPPGLWESFESYSAQRALRERVGAWERFRILVRRRVSELCMGLIIFMNVTCETATRRLSRYVLES